MSDTFKKEFDTLRTLGEDTFVLRGSSIIVEILDPEEIKTDGGIIIARDPKHTRGNSVEAHKVEVGRVLMCGQGYWNDNPDYGATDENGKRSVLPGYYQPLEVQPGAIVLLPQYSLQLLSHFPGIKRPTGNRLAMIKMDAIAAYYPSEEAYNKAKQKLNG